MMGTTKGTSPKNTLAERLQRSRRHRMWAKNQMGGKGDSHSVSGASVSSIGTGAEDVPSPQKQATDVSVTASSSGETHDANLLPHQQRVQKKLAEAMGQPSSGDLSSVKSGSASGSASVQSNTPSERRHESLAHRRARAMQRKKASSNSHSNQTQEVKPDPSPPTSVVVKQKQAKPNMPVESKLPPPAALPPSQQTEEKKLPDVTSAEGVKVESKKSAKELAIERARKAIAEKAHGDTTTPKLPAKTPPRSMTRRQLIHNMKPSNDDTEDILSVVDDKPQSTVEQKGSNRVTVDTSQKPSTGNKYFPPSHSNGKMPMPTSRLFPTAASPKKETKSEESPDPSKDPPRRSPFDIGSQSFTPPKKSITPPVKKEHAPYFPPKNEVRSPVAAQQQAKASPAILPQRSTPTPPSQPKQDSVVVAPQQPPPGPVILPVREKKNESIAFPQRQVPGPVVLPQREKQIPVSQPQRQVPGPVILPQREKQISMAQSQRQVPGPVILPQREKQMPMAQSQRQVPGPVILPQRDRLVHETRQSVESPPSRTLNTEYDTQRPLSSGQDVEPSLERYEEPPSDTVQSQFDDDGYDYILDRKDKPGQQQKLEEDEEQQTKVESSIKTRTVGPVVMPEIPAPVILPQKERVRHVGPQSQEPPHEHTNRGPYSRQRQRQDRQYHQNQYPTQTEPEAEQNSPEITSQHDRRQQHSDEEKEMLPPVALPQRQNPTTTVAPTGPVILPQRNSVPQRSNNPVSSNQHKQQLPPGPAILPLKSRPQPTSSNQYGNQHPPQKPLPLQKPVPPPKMDLRGNSILQQENSEPEPDEDFSFAELQRKARADSTRSAATTTNSTTPRQFYQSRNLEADGRTGSSDFHGNFADHNNNGDSSGRFVHGHGPVHNKVHRQQQPSTADYSIKSQQPVSLPSPRPSSMKQDTMRQSNETPARPSHTVSTDPQSSGGGYQRPMPSTKKFTFGAIQTGMDSNDDEMYPDDEKPSVRTSFGAVIETPRSTSVRNLASSFNMEGDKPLMPINCTAPQLRHNFLSVKGEDEAETPISRTSERHFGGRSSFQMQSPQSLASPSKPKHNEDRQRELPVRANSPQMQVPSPNRYQDRGSPHLRTASPSRSFDRQTTSSASAAQRRAPSPSRSFDRPSGPESQRSPWQKRTQQTEGSTPNPSTSASLPPARSSWSGRSSPSGTKTLVSSPVVAPKQNGTSYPNRNPANNNSPIGMRNNQQSAGQRLSYQPSSSRPQSYGPPRTTTTITPPEGSIGVPTDHPILRKYKEAHGQDPTIDTTEAQQHQAIRSDRVDEPSSSSAAFSQSQQQPPPFQADDAVSYEPEASHDDYKQQSKSSQNSQHAVPSSPSHSTIRTNEGGQNVVHQDNSNINFGQSHPPPPRGDFKRQLFVDSNETDYGHRPNHTIKKPSSQLLQTQKGSFPFWQPRSSPARENQTNSNDFNVDRAIASPEAPRSKPPIISQAKHAKTPERTVSIPDRHATTPERSFSTPERIPEVSSTFVNSPARDQNDDGLHQEGPRESAYVEEKKLSEDDNLCQHSDDDGSADGIIGADSQWKHLAEMAADSTLITDYEAAFKQATRQLSCEDGEEDSYVSGGFTSSASAIPQDLPPEFEKVLLDKPVSSRRSQGPVDTDDFVPDDYAETYTPENIPEPQRDVVEDITDTYTDAQTEANTEAYTEANTEAYTEASSYRSDKRYPLLKASLRDNDTYRKTYYGDGSTASVRGRQRSGRQSPTKKGSSAAKYRSGRHSDTLSVATELLERHRHDRDDMSRDSHPATVALGDTKEYSRKAKFDDFASTIRDLGGDMDGNGSSFPSINNYDRSVRGSSRKSDTGFEEYPDPDLEEIRSDVNSDVVFGNPMTFGAAGGENSATKSSPSILKRGGAIEDWDGGRGVPPDYDRGFDLRPQQISPERNKADGASQILKFWSDNNGNENAEAEYESAKRSFADHENWMHRDPDFGNGLRDPSLSPSQRNGRNKLSLDKDNINMTGDMDVLKTWRKSSPPKHKDDRSSRREYMNTSTPKSTTSRQHASSSKRKSKQSREAVFDPFGDEDYMASDEQDMLFSSTQMFSGAVSTPSRGGRRSQSSSTGFRGVEI